MKSDFLTHSYLALREKLFRSALGFLKDEEDAKDAMQDAYVSLWSKNPVTSDSEAGNKLFTVLKNRCIDILKHQSHKNTSVEKAGEVFVNPVYYDITSFERLLISNLSEWQRKVYQYIVQDGFEYDTVARLTGKSTEAIRTEMCRIRKKIQCNLKKMEI